MSVEILIQVVLIGNSHVNGGWISVFTPPPPPPHMWPLDLSHSIYNSIKIPLCPRVWRTASETNAVGGKLNFLSCYTEGARWPGSCHYVVIKLINATVVLWRRHAHSGLPLGRTRRHSIHTLQAHRWLVSEVRVTPHLRLCGVFTVSHIHTHTHTAAVSCLDAHVIGPQTGDVSFLQCEAIAQVSGPSGPWESWRSESICSQRSGSPPTPASLDLTHTHTNTSARLTAGH